MKKIICVIIGLILLLVSATATEFVFTAGDSCELTGNHKTRYAVKIYDFDTYSTGIPYAIGEISATNTRQTEICFSPQLSARSNSIGEICNVTINSIDLNHEMISIQFNTNEEFTQSCLVKSGDLLDGDLIDVNASVDAVVGKLIDERIQEDLTLWNYLDGKILAEINPALKDFQRKISEKINEPVALLTKNTNENSKQIDQLKNGVLALVKLNKEIKTENQQIREWNETQQIVIIVIIIAVLLAWNIGRKKRKNNTMEYAPPLTHIAGEING